MSTEEEFETGLQNLVAALAQGCRPDKVRAKRFGEYIRNHVAAKDARIAELEKWLAESEMVGKWHVRSIPLSPLSDEEKEPIPE